jgi:diguanylate cyclase (GGDEF)-like protein/PAS domain S-box-containing protein
MSGLWQGLLSSMAVVGAVTSIWTQARAYFAAAPLRQSITFGVVMGTGSILSMMTNFEAQPGLFFDARAALVAIAGFFGGPPAGLLAALIAVTYRFWSGGVGAPAGGVGIACVAAIGIVGSRLVAGREIRKRHVVGLAAATAASSMVGAAFLPPAAKIAATPFIAGPGAGLIFVATLLAGLAILHEIRLHEALEANIVYRAIVEVLPDCLNFKNLAGKFAAANSATARLMRARSARDLIGKTDFDFYPEDIARRFRADEEAVIAEGAPKTIEQKASFPDGSVAWLSTLKAPMRDGQGQLVGLITLNRDITDKKRLEDQLRIAHEHLEDALSNMADGLVLYNREGIIEYSNLQYRRLFPMTADLRVPGMALRDIIRQSIERGEEQRPETTDFEEGLTQRCQAILKPGERTIHLSSGRWIAARTRNVREGGALILFTDITDRKQAEDSLTKANERLARLALCDGLTGLTNRRGFDHAFEKEFARGAREGKPLGVLLIDVDKFKTYNDTYGHQSGDRCLQLISQEIQAILKRPGDLGARYGGEEFVALLPDTDAAGAIRVGETLRAAVKSLNLLHKGSDRGVVTISIGATSHVPGQEFRQPEDLLRRADDALYGAKASGRDQVMLDAMLSPQVILEKAS